MSLEGKVALITGGGTGLGRVVARHLAREGMHVAVHYSRSERDAQETLQSLRELGVRAQAFAADLNAPTRVADTRAMLDAVANAFGRLDLVVNNAATTRAVPFQSLELVTAEDWDLVLNVNVQAPFFVAQAAVPILRQSGGGQIINTASISGLRASGGSSIAYSVSKAALIQLTRCLATAVAPDIRVNAVAPGLMRTRWLAHFSDEQIRAAAQQAPLKKVADLDDTAQAYVMLANNTSITGQVIVVDAGLTL